MYKSYIHIINLYEKKTIKQVNIKKIHILQKYTIKINFLKLSLNKKIVVLLTRSAESLLKFELEYECWQTKCWDDQICNDKLICSKIRGVCYLLERKMKEKEEEMGRERGRSLS
jgi:hypothetical protein